MKIDLTNGKVSTVIPKIKPPGRLLDNWLMAYLDYTRDNEAPQEYHMWVGLGTIAGASQRKVLMSATYYDVLTNQYILLVAPPGTARKTTALKIGQSILKNVPNINFTTKAGSPSALIKQLADLPNKEHQSITTYSYEFGTMMANNQAEMVDLITDLYDGNPDWDKQTIARGLEKIPRPWLNLLAGTTPMWIGDNMNSTFVEGGFTSRSLYIYSDQRILKSAFPVETPWHKEMRRKLINDLTHISTLEGQFTFTDESWKFYDAWYHDERRFPENVDNRTSGYYERKHVHVLKVAMALSMAEKDELVLELKDIQTALKILRNIEPGLHKSFSAVGRNIYATDLLRMLDQIEKKKEVSYGEIIARNIHAMDKKTIDLNLDTLADMGDIRILPGRKIQFIKNGSSR